MHRLEQFHNLLEENSRQRRLRMRNGCEAIIQESKEMLKEKWRIEVDLLISCGSPEDILNRASIEIGYWLKEVWYMFVNL